MKIEIEQTATIVQMNGVPCRVWTGKTAKGVECQLFVVRVAVAENQGEQVQDEFERELIETAVPRAETHVWPARMVL